ncbi:DHH family phosphoesterase [Sediminicola luteus]|uniref:DHH family phosphoesterase n=1 Tax=Sediminicola luteus TaxID=319238 RepID=A0A2A4GAT0_9FLAO|nr:bifunctional oligoribonuclease/PAP phosphatase NrnA [Sediminicola luteus]PCE64852.1 DHH family phosphoesterase [Sediminicola luteus]
MTKADIASLSELLADPKKILIIPHKNPDGDAMGSTLALCHYLRGQGHKARVMAPNEYPKFLKWLPGNDQVLVYDRNPEAGNRYIREAAVIFTLDFNDLDRAHTMSPMLKEATGTFVMVDHHEEPKDYAQITFSDPKKGSTCEMVYDLICALGGQARITSDMAQCLYTGIMTDSGSFRFPSTTGTTHRIVADLIDRGADNSAIHQRIYDTNNPSRLQLLGKALNNMVILPEFRTAYITLSQEELDSANYKKGDTEGFVNYGLSLKNIIFAVIFIENTEEGIIKISFRSQGDFEVNQFSKHHFSGGGHMNAAGGRSSASLEDTVSRFLDLLPQYQDKLNA